MSSGYVRCVRCLTEWSDKGLYVDENPLLFVPNDRSCKGRQKKGDMRQETKERGQKIETGVC